MSVAVVAIAAVIVEFLLTILVSVIESLIRDLVTIVI